MKQNAPLKHFTQTALQGLFGLLPVVIIVVLILWLYGKIDLLVNWAFRLVGFAPQKHEFLWFLLVIIVFIFLLYIIGHLMKTRLAGFLESLLEKIPGYSTIKDIIRYLQLIQRGGEPGTCRCHTGLCRGRVQYRTYVLTKGEHHQRPLHGHTLHVPYTQRRIYV